MSNPNIATVGHIAINGRIRPIWRTEVKPTRFNGKCGGCKRVLSALMTATIDAGRYVLAEGDIAAHPLSNGCVYVVCCGRERELRPVHGTYNPRIPCTARCVDAKGHSCDCHCAGKNHGGAHAV